LLINTILPELHLDGLLYIVFRVVGIYSYAALTRVLGLPLFPKYWGDFPPGVKMPGRCS